MKTFIAAVAAAAAIVGASPAQALPGISQDEIDFLNDIEAVGIINSGGDSGVLEGGWTVCGILYQGYPRSWVAEQIYLGSQESNGSAGMTYGAAQALVFYANANLCPGVGK